MTSMSWLYACARACWNIARARGSTGRRSTDYIDETISGVKLKIRFLRVNQRHH
jgi:hypothetical protein